MSKNVRVSVPVENLNYLADALDLRVWDKKISTDDNNVINHIEFSKPNTDWVRGTAHKMKDGKIELELDHMDECTSAFNNEIATAYSAVKIMREVETMKNIIVNQESPYIMENNQVTVNVKAILA